MADCLPGHPHALLDSEGKVLNVALFDGHDHELLDLIRSASGAASVACCCNLGLAQVGGTFDGKKFLPPPPAPDPEPEPVIDPAT